MAGKVVVPEDFMQGVEEQIVSHQFDRDRRIFKVIDQLLLPRKHVWIDIKGADDAYRVIKNMQVRGAPFIATVAMLGLYMDAELDSLRESDDDYINKLKEKVAMLVSSRPTAVNLRNACDDVLAALDGGCGRAVDKFRVKVLAEYDAEKASNRQLVWSGASELLALRSNGKPPGDSGDGLTIMTICNTGSCATCSWGTALGVIMGLHYTHHLKKAVVLETRPYLQGSRLTAYELCAHKAPFTLITDGMAATAMRNLRVDAVIVGADQVTSNGDTANKVGTYGLAVLAAYHKIPFYVALPMSTFNPRLADGSEIVIEERPATELTRINGELICPEDTPAWNPAFDITPSTLIHKYITEYGVLNVLELGEAYIKYIG